MVAQKAKARVNNFSGGLMTDFQPLNSPENISVDEDNCDLDRRGFRRRRLGFTYEDGYSFSEEPVNQDAVDTFYIKTYKWSAVNNDPDLQFLVVQFGNVLYFYDRSYDPLSDGAMDFTVDLDDFAAPGVASTANKGIQVASGKGVLFVVGELIEPFYITYNESDATITTTEITIRIRDLKLLDRTTDYEARPLTLTDALKYDLYNQGWGYNKVTGNDSVRYGTTVTLDAIALDYYFISTDRYPPRTKPWWIGNRSAIDPGESGFGEIFDPTGMYDPTYAGNTLAPLGHFILNAFEKDRATAAGFGSFQTEVDFTRPTAVEFAAGHVFYGHKNQIYFSQLITDDLTAAGECYQQADPTSKDVNELIATDGGVIMTPTSGKAIKFLAHGNSILCFYDNGIWAISGGQPGDGFSATSHSVSKIASEGALSSRTIFTVEGQPTYWSEGGINILSSSEGVAGSFKVTSLTANKIQDFYDDISPLAKEFASGAYDKIKKRIVWLFNSDTDIQSDQERFYYNRVLNYDLTKQAFFPYTISDKPVSQPSRIVDVFNKHTSSLLSSEEAVTDGGVIVTDGGETVTTTVRVFSTDGPVASDVKYLVTGPTIPIALLSTGFTCGELGEDNVPATAGIVGNWLTPDAISCNNGSFASISVSYGGDGVTPPVEDYYVMPYIRISNFGFAIPTGATITGVRVSYEFGFKAGVPPLFEEVVRLAWGASASTLSTENKAEDLQYPPGGMTTLIRGDIDDTWGDTLTPAIVNSSDFGFVLKLRRPDPQAIPSVSWFSNGIGVDNFKVNIYYTI